MCVCVSAAPLDATESITRALTSVDPRTQHNGTGHMPYKVAQRAGFLALASLLRYDAQYSLDPSHTHMPAFSVRSKCALDWVAVLTRASILQVSLCVCVCVTHAGLRSR